MHLSERISIRGMNPSDWPAVRAIYLEGIATGNATFEQNRAGLGNRWNAAHLETCRLVARLDGEGSSGGPR